MKLFQKFKEFFAIDRSMVEFNQAIFAYAKAQDSKAEKWNRVVASIDHLIINHGRSLHLCREMLATIDHTARSYPVAAVETLDRLLERPAEINPVFHPAALSRIHDLTPAYAAKVGSERAELLKQKYETANDVLPIPALDAALK